MAHDSDWLSFITDLPESILRFGLKAVIDALPSLANLKRWSLIRPGHEMCPLFFGLALIACLNYS